jgi:hypothetical protein
MHRGSPRGDSRPGRRRASSFSSISSPAGSAAPSMSELPATLPEAATPIGKTSSKASHGDMASTISSITSRTVRRKPPSGAKSSSRSGIEPGKSGSSKRATPIGTTFTPISFPEVAPLVLDLSAVIPAKAGIQFRGVPQPETRRLRRRWGAHSGHPTRTPQQENWIPAFAGMTPWIGESSVRSTTGRACIGTYPPTQIVGGR